MVGFIQAQENLNNQLAYENNYLKDEMSQLKVNLLKLIDENTNLHGELKSVTVSEILNELPNLINKSNATTKMTRVNTNLNAYQNGGDDTESLKDLLRNKEYLIN